MSPRIPEGARVAPETPKMSALQQLAAKRKAEQSNTASHQKDIVSPSAQPAANAPPPAKPMSKLAQLAAQRKAAAGASSAKELPTTMAAEGDKSPVSAPPAAREQQKPVSKLAQRIADAKAAKARADAEARSTSLSSEVRSSPQTQPVQADRSDAMDVDQAEKPSPLFTFPAQLERNLPNKESLPCKISFSSYAGAHPSGFFTLLTTPPKTNLHVPGNLQKDALEKRRRRSRQGNDPFEELDPDEAVMKAREGTRLDVGAVKVRK